MNDSHLNGFYWLQSTDPVCMWRGWVINVINIPELFGFLAASVKKVIRCTSPIQKLLIYNYRMLESASPRPAFRASSEPTTRTRHSYFVRHSKTIISVHRVLRSSSGSEMKALESNSAKLG